jgi:hypothetical protein
MAPDDSAVRVLKILSSTRYFMPKSNKLSGERVDNAANARSVIAGLTD